jgi:anti-sigma factor RsiW
MDAQKRHLTDTELLCRLDNELSESCVAAVDRHLDICKDCRKRRDTIAEMAAAATANYRAVVVSDVVTERSLARLKSNIARAAEPTNKPWAVTFGGATTPSRSAWAGVAVTMAVALVGLLSLWQDAGSAGADALLTRHGVLPVASITPGATWDITATELCAGTRHTRTITAAMRAEVVAAYRVEQVPQDRYELDYLITPELGGATDTRNLWPQAYASPVWNARIKDALEQLLPELVCSGKIDLETAQREIASDWIAAYKRYFNTDVPLQAHRGLRADDDDPGAQTYLLADAGSAPAIRLVSLAVLR